jgi:hypothetical protein
MTRFARCFARLCLLLALPVALAACDDGHIGVQLSADPPAAATTREVDLTIASVTLQRDDGTTDRIKLDSSVRVNLMNFDAAAYQLLDSESLDAGTYTGIRVDFDDSSSDSNDNYVVDTSNNQHPVTVNANNLFAPLNLKVKKKGGKSYVIDVRMDLRLSLSTGSSPYQLTPVIRAVRDTKAAKVSGTVKNSLISTSSCKGSGNTGAGVAIYAFSPQLADGDKPDDYDGAQPDPFATTPVRSNGSGNWTYSFLVMPPGDYTLALTCQGNLEDPAENQDDTIDFLSDTHGISLDSGESDSQDFN